MLSDLGLVCGADSFTVFVVLPFFIPKEVSTTYKGSLPCVIFLMRLKNASSTLMLSLALVSIKGHFHVFAKACPCSVLTRLSLSKSILLPTRMKKICNCKK